MCAARFARKVAAPQRSLPVCDAAVCFWMASRALRSSIISARHPSQYCLFLLADGCGAGLRRFSADLWLLPARLRAGGEACGASFACCWYFVFVLVVGSFGSFPYPQLYPTLHNVFIVEFSQNLYFSCLVLNTLLYVMIQQLAIDDDELGLLVCGMGVQFAGEAACLALLHLTLGENFAASFSVS